MENNETKTVSWNANNLKTFKKIYLKNVADKNESFIFEGNEFLTSYAKYLIAYLNTKL